MAFCVEDETLTDLLDLVQSEAKLLNLESATPSDVVEINGKSATSSTLKTLPPSEIIIKFRMLCREYVRLTKELQLAHYERELGEDELNDAQFELQEVKHELRKYRETNLLLKTKFNELYQSHSALQSKLRNMSLDSFNNYIAAEDSYPDEDTEVFQDCQEILSPMNANSKELEKKEVLISLSPSTLAELDELPNLPKMNNIEDKLLALIGLMKKNATMHSFSENEISETSRS